MQVKYSYKSSEAMNIACTCGFPNPPKPHAGDCPVRERVPLHPDLDTEALFATLREVFPSTEPYEYVSMLRELVEANKLAELALETLHKKLRWTQVEMGRANNARQAAEAALVGAPGTRGTFRHKKRVRHLCKVAIEYASMAAGYDELTHAALSYGNAVLASRRGASPGIERTSAVDAQGAAPSDAAISSPNDRRVLGAVDPSPAGRSAEKSAASSQPRAGITCWALDEIAAMAGAVLATDSLVDAKRYAQAILEDAENERKRLKGTQ